MTKHVQHDSILRRMRRETSRAVSLVWFLINLAIVSLSADKHRHYITAAADVFIACRSACRVHKLGAKGRRLIDKRWVLPIAASSLAAGLAFISVVVLGRTLLPVAPTISCAAASLESPDCLVAQRAMQRPSGYYSMLLLSVCYIGVNGSILSQGDPRLHSRVRPRDPHW
jgi:4-amino-4-deoxy-L-arabinose transferase-like glycosyltransferase